MLATGMPTRNEAVARDRHTPGNHRVNNRYTPGVNPGPRGDEQEAHEPEGDGTGHEAAEGGDQAPRNHDPRDPAPGADALHHEVGWDLAQEVADEEQPGAPAELRRRE